MFYHIYMLLAIFEVVTYVKKIDLVTSIQIDKINYHNNYVWIDILYMTNFDTQIDREL